MASVAFETVRFHFRLHLETFFDGVGIDARLANKMSVRFRGDREPVGHFHALA